MTIPSAKAEPAAPIPPAESARGAVGVKIRTGAVVSRPTPTKGSSGTGQFTPSDLSNTTNCNGRARTQSDYAHSLLSGHPPSGAPGDLFYWWRRPKDARVLEQYGWALEAIDARYGSWLMKRDA